MNNKGADSRKNRKNTSDTDEAYVYVVRNPSYNDVTLAAWDSVLYAGTPVMYETRFGLDLGMIVGPAPVPGSSYTPGCSEIHGACLHFGGEKEEDDPRYPLEEGEHQCSCCTSCRLVGEPDLMKVDGDITWIDHLATPSDMARYTENTEKEEYALRICREKIRKRGLNMKLVTTHFLLGEPKVIFFFTAEERVDFRDLVKDLVSVFRMRIELRQIGVRDESRLIGGLSVCGRDYCCHLISKEMEHVTIKMAKEQDLSLNSMKISGPCGRLLCCLAYEYDNYLEEKAQCPPEGTKMKIDHDIWRVTGVNILSQMITLSANGERTLSVPFEEVYYDTDTGYWKLSEEYAEELFPS